ncbi:hypothetical protein JHK87_001503 [Glycine soja]|nr:hypothetical protein JHK87_001503 [Glycine soja]
MDTSVLFNFLLNDQECPVPFPWQAIIDIQKNLVYYRNNETEFVIYDFRPLVDLGGGVFFENTIGSRFIDQEVLHEISNLQDFQNIPKLFLFSTSCSGVTFNGIVEQPVIRCPLCDRIKLVSQTCQGTIAFGKQNEQLQNNMVEGLDNQFDK